MKKILVLALCLVLSFTLVACGSEKTPDIVQSPDTEDSTETPLPSESANTVTQSPETEEPSKTPLSSESVSTVTQPPKTQKPSKTPPSSESVSTVTQPPKTEEPSETPLPPEPTETVPESPDTEEPIETPVPSESAEPVVPTYQNVEDFIANSQDEIDQIIAALENSGMHLKIIARDNSLVYIYQFYTDLGDTALVKDTLEQTLEAMSDSFAAELSSLKLIVPSAESIIIEYLDIDGNMLVSKEYK